MEHHHEHSCNCHSHEHSCGCHSHEHHEAKIPLLPRIIAGIAFCVCGFLVPKFELIFFALAYIVLGYDILFAAIRKLLKLKPLDESFLMSIAAIGAFLLGEHFEAAAIMLFYQIGEYFGDNASKKVKASISTLLDVRPDSTRIATTEGVKTVACEAIKVGDIVLAGAGERIAIDGKIVKGSATVDTSSLTGESTLRFVDVGDTVLAGMISSDGSLEIVAEKEFSESTLSRILALAEEEHSKKSNTERFITSFAKVYTPIVVLLAGLVALLPPIFGLGSFSDWIFRALSFLVISCPCALVVSVPLTLFAAMGCFSKNGILVKNSVTIENLTKIKTIAFDKTGTLTIGTPSVTEISATISDAELLELAAYAECDSTHPLAAAIRAAYTKEIDRTRIKELSEITARGIRAKIDDSIILVGSQRLMCENNINLSVSASDNSIFVAKDGEYVGYICFSDQTKPDAEKAIASLGEMGIGTVMLSGDNEHTAMTVSKQIGINKYFAELLPNDKAMHIKALTESGAVMFVGDGINDLPSIAAASVGVAMGGIGSDAAIEGADMVIMGDEPSRIAPCLRLAKNTMRIARQNIVLAIGIKVFVMLLATAGIGGMLPAIFADVGVLLITVANALRAYYIKFK